MDDRMRELRTNCNNVEQNDEISTSYHDNSNNCIRFKTPEKRWFERAPKESYVGNDGKYHFKKSDDNLVCIDESKKKFCFRCGVCFRCFALVHSLKRHFERNHINPTFLTSQTLKDGELVRHTHALKLFRPDLPSGNQGNPDGSRLLYVCRVQGCEGEQFFNNYDDLIYHNNTRHPPKSNYLCGRRECADIEFRSVEEFNKHMMRHLEIRKFACQYCSESFAKVNDLHGHVLKVHNVDPESLKYRRRKWKQNPQPCTQPNIIFPGFTETQNIEPVLTDPEMTLQEPHQNKDMVTTPCCESPTVSSPWMPFTAPFESDENHESSAKELDNSNQNQSYKTTKSTRLKLAKSTSSGEKIEDIANSLKRKKENPLKESVEENHNLEDSSEEADMLSYENNIQCNNNQVPVCQSVFINSISGSLEHLPALHNQNNISGNSYPDKSAFVPQTTYIAREFPTSQKLMSPSFTHMHTNTRLSTKDISTTRTRNQEDNLFSLNTATTSGSTSASSNDIHLNLENFATTSKRVSHTHINTALLEKHFNYNNSQSFVNKSAHNINSKRVSDPVSNLYEQAAKRSNLAQEPPLFVAATSSNAIQLPLHSRRAESSNNTDLRFIVQVEKLTSHEPINPEKSLLVRQQVKLQNSLSQEKNVAVKVSSVSNHNHTNVVDPKPIQTVKPLNKSFESQQLVPLDLSSKIAIEPEEPVEALDLRTKPSVRDQISGPNLNTPAEKNLNNINEMQLKACSSNNSSQVISDQAPLLMNSYTSNSNGMVYNCSNAKPAKQPILNHLLQREEVHHIKSLEYKDRSDMTGHLSEISTLNPSKTNKNFGQNVGIKSPQPNIISQVKQNRGVFKQRQTMPGKTHHHNLRQEQTSNLDKQNNSSALNQLLAPSINQKQIPINKMSQRCPVNISTTASAYKDSQLLYESLTQKSMISVSKGPANSGNMLPSRTLNQITFNETNVDQNQDLARGNGINSSCVTIRSATMRPNLQPPSTFQFPATDAALQSRNQKSIANPKSRRKVMKPRKTLPSQCFPVINDESVHSSNTSAVNEKAILNETRRTSFGEQQRIYMSRPFVHSDLVQTNSNMQPAHQLVIHGKNDGHPVTKKQQERKTKTGRPRKIYTRKRKNNNSKSPKKNQFSRPPFSDSLPRSSDPHSSYHNPFSSHSFYSSPHSSSSGPHPSHSNTHFSSGSHPSHSNTHFSSGLNFPYRGPPPSYSRSQSSFLGAQNPSGLQLSDLNLQRSIHPSPFCPPFGPQHKMVLQNRTSFDLQNSIYHDHQSHSSPGNLNYLTANLPSRVKTNSHLDVNHPLQQVTVTSNSSFIHSFPTTSGLAQSTFTHFPPSHLSVQRPSKSYLPPSITGGDQAHNSQNDFTNQCGTARTTSVTNASTKATGAAENNDQLCASSSNKLTSEQPSTITANTRSHSDLDDAFRIPSPVNVRDGSNLSLSVQQLTKEIVRDFENRRVSFISFPPLPSPLREVDEVFKFPLSSEESCSDAESSTAVDNIRVSKDKNGEEILAKEDEAKIREEKSKNDDKQRKKLLTKVRELLAKSKADRQARLSSFDSLFTDSDELDEFSDSSMVGLKECKSSPQHDSDNSDSSGIRLSPSKIKAKVKKYARNKGVKSNLEDIVKYGSDEKVRLIKSQKRSQKRSKSKVGHSRSSSSKSTSQQRKGVKLLLRAKYSTENLNDDDEVNDQISEAEDQHSPFHSASTSSNVAQLSSDYLKEFLNSSRYQSKSTVAADDEEELPGLKERVLRSKYSVRPSARNSPSKRPLDEVMAASFQNGRQMRSRKSKREIAYDLRRQLLRIQENSLQLRSNDVSNLHAWQEVEEQFHSDVSVDSFTTNLQSLVARLNNSRKRTISFGGNEGSNSNVDGFSSAEPVRKRRKRACRQNDNKKYNDDELLFAYVSDGDDNINLKSSRLKSNCSRDAAASKALDESAKSNSRLKQLSKPKSSRKTIASSVIDRGNDRNLFDVFRFNDEETSSERNSSRENHPLPRRTSVRKRRKKSYGMDFF